MLLLGTSTVFSEGGPGGKNRKMRVLRLAQTELCFHKAHFGVLSSLVLLPGSVHLTLFSKKILLFQRFTKPHFSFVPNISFQYNNIGISSLKNTVYIFVNVQH